MASRVVSRAAGLGALTAAGQFVIVTTLPTYSRLFDPGRYGEYVVFVGTVGVVSVLAGLRYDSAIVLPRNDRMARALSALVMVIALAVATSVGVAALALRSLAPTPSGAPIIEASFAYGLTLATAMSALQRCLTSWCVRSSAFLAIGVGQFVFALTTVVAQLSLVRVTAQLPALIYGYVWALGFQIVCLAAPVLAGLRPGWARAVTWRGMKIAARKYRRFPTYMVGYALASSARDRLIQIVLGIGAGADAVGRFGLGYRVAFAPNSLIYSAISPIFFGIASRGSRAAVGRLAANLAETTFIVLLVPYVAFALEAPAATDQLLSVKWHGTGVYLQALAGPALLLAATCWMDRAFDSFRRQNAAFLLEASFTLASVTLVAVLSRLIDPVSVAWAFGTLGMIYYWTYFLVTFVACEFPLADFRHACVTGALAAATALSLGGLVHQLTALGVRLAAYAVLMLVTIVCWARFRHGAETLRVLLQARVGGEARS
jgi:O-antigen/teichoic acid export membrane protein